MIASDVEDRSKFYPPHGRLAVKHGRAPTLHAEEARPVHLVMFDIDGTLLGSHGFDGDLFARAVRREFGVQVDETWQSYQHCTDSGVLEGVLITKEVVIRLVLEAADT